MKKLGLLALCACTSNPSPPKPAIAVSPDTADVLTCSTQQLTATVTNVADGVSWTASPGSIDATGLYTSPLATPSDGMASVTATSVADPSLAATAQLTLATAFPGTPVAIPTAPGNSGALGTVGVYQHSVVARGSRVYAVWQDNPASSSDVSLQVARSDDGGATWQAAKPAFAATLKAGTDTSDNWVECPSLAIDSANPDVVYAVGRISGSNSLGAEVGAPDQPTLVFAMSSDGGQSFTETVLHADIPIGYCADVISPAADTVVIDDPVDDCTNDKDVWVWSDVHRGAGFAQGTQGTGTYLSNGTTHGLDDADGRACANPARVDIETDGTTGIGGEATESPRLFTDGAGRVCITYVGDTTAMSPTPVHAYVQCSDDLGKTFSAPIALDTAAPGLYHSHATGAFGQGGDAAIAWASSADDTNLSSDIYVALSSDHGHTFGPATRIASYAVPGATGPTSMINPSLMYDAAGILWLGYRVGDGQIDRIIIDKSCDGGTTWSGPVLVNGTEDQVTSSTFVSMKWPVLIDGPGDAPHLAATPDDKMCVFGLAP